MGAREEISRSEKATREWGKVVGHIFTQCPSENSKCRLSGKGEGGGRVGGGGGDKLPLNKTLSGD